MYHSVLLVSLSDLTPHPSVLFTPPEVNNANQTVLLRVQS